MKWTRSIAEGKGRLSGRNGPKPFEKKQPLSFSEKPLRPLPIGKMLRPQLAAHFILKKRGFPKT